MDKNEIDRYFYGVQLKLFDEQAEKLAILVDQKVTNNAEEKAMAKDCCVTLRNLIALARERLESNQ